MVKYNALETGDLLVWGKSTHKTCYLFDCMRIVRLFTLSNYGHVSVAWVNSNVNFHVEAVRPKIQATMLHHTDDLYVIPMQMGIGNVEMLRFFGDKLGLPYGTMDAFRAWAGITLKDPKKWQCAELALDFYREMGLDVADAYTPSALVKTLMRDFEKPLLKLNL